MTVTDGYELRRIADAAQRMQEGAADDALETVVYAQAVEDVCRYLAGDAPARHELDSILDRRAL